MQNSTIIFYILAIVAIIADAKIRFKKTNESEIEKITGGSLASIERFPYLVYVLHGEKACGGSIISKNHILTAAHCVCRIPRLCYVHSGSANRGEEGTWTEVNRIICHEKFDETGVAENDVAILVLGAKYSLKFDKKTQSIPLVERRPKKPSWGYVSGWGHLDNAQTESEEMRIAAVEIADEKKCKDRFHIYQTPGTFCAGTKDGRDACFGDSGGPLAVRGQLVGIVSQGPQKCGYTNSIYVSVAYYRDWILQKMVEPVPEGSESGFWNKLWDQAKGLAGRN